MKWFARIFVLVALVTISVSTSTGLVGPQVGPRAQASGCPSVPTTPYFTIAYGTVQVNGTAAPVGTVVEATSPRGDVVGCFEVTIAGHYGAMYVYGEDASVSPSIPGMRDGETVAFHVNGGQAAVSPALIWHDDRALHQVDLTATAAPMPISDLAASRLDEHLVLTWSPVTENTSGQPITGVTYRIYRAANDPYFIPGVTPYATTANTNYVDWAVLGDPAVNYFYIVTAVDTGGTESDLSNRVGEFDFELHETTGTDYTWISLPLVDSSLPMASDLEAHIEANCSESISVLSIARWNAPGQQLVQYTTIPIPIGDFPLQAGWPYRVEGDISAVNDCVWTLLGAVPDEGAVSFDLLTTTGTDYTWISLPLDQGGLAMASDLEAAIEAESTADVLSICRWNAIGQQFVCYTTVPIPIGDFGLNPGYAYRIEVSGETTWP